MSRTYVPGYGYVDDSAGGTRGSVRPGAKPRDTGQTPARRPQYQAPIGPGLGVNRPPQYQAPIGPGMGPQYVVNPDGQIVVAGQQSGGMIADLGRAWVASVTGGTVSTSSDFNPSTGGAALSAYQNNPPTDMYKSFEMLRPEEKNFWALMAANYHSSSTPEAQYAKFAEIAMQQGQASGVWANPTGIAMRHARDMNYDMRNVYVPDARVSMAMRRGAEQFELGAYDADFQGFSGTVDTSSSGGYPSGGGGYGGGGGGGGSVSLTNPTSARGLLMQTMQSVLGRNPTSKEYTQFMDALKQAEMDNPMTVSVEGDTVVQSGGTDPGMIALDFAESTGDAKAVKTSRYTDMLLSIIGGV